MFGENGRNINDPLLLNLQQGLAKGTEVEGKSQHKCTAILQPIYYGKDRRLGTADEITIKET